MRSSGICFGWGTGRFACSLERLVAGVGAGDGLGADPRAGAERARFVRAHRRSVQRWLDDLDLAGVTTLLARLRARLTYANITATLALFLALGGTSYAALKLPRNSVGSKQIRSGAVTSRAVHDRSIRLRDVSVATRKSLSGGQGPAGPVGPPG